MLCVCFNYDLVGFSFGCPQDTDDFNRCYKLVTAIPWIKTKFYKLANTGKQWAKIVDNWDQLCQMLQKQIQTGEDSGLYDLLKKFEIMKVEHFIANSIREYPTLYKWER